jgi:ribosomal protein L11 methyltransferase
MNHIQLSIEATEPEQDQLIGQLTLLNATGFEQTETHLLAYFEEDAFPGYEVHELLKKFAFQLNTVTEQNWNAEWEKSFQPVIVEGFCAVRAHFHSPIATVPHEIIITPKMSFGTGHHATTYMMLQHMQHLDFGGKQVLDFGTGTGVLAILAEKLGAAQVTAIDNDLWSFENVQENLHLNQCSRVTPLLADQIPASERYDVVLANITRNVLLHYMDVLKSCLQPGGSLLLSGLLENDGADLLAATANRGMKLVRHAVRAGWLSLLFVNESENKPQ